MQEQTKTVTLQDYFDNVYKSIYPYVCDDKPMEVIFLELDGSLLFHYHNQDMTNSSKKLPFKECFIVDNTALFVGKEAVANKAPWCELRLNLLALALIRRGYTVKTRFPTYDLLLNEQLLPDIYKIPALYTAIAGYTFMSTLDDSQNLTTLWMRDALVVSAWALIPYLQSKNQEFVDDKLIIDRLKIKASQLCGH